jgi:hypothetical protein
MNMVRSITLFVALLLGFTTGLASAEASSGGLSISHLDFIGETFIPFGLEVDGTVVLGLSGLTRVGNSNEYLAICDDTDGGPARYYSLTIDLDDGSLDEGDVSVNSVTLLTDENGPVPLGTFDLEGIALDPGTITLLYASEGRGDGPEAAHAPFIKRNSRFGQFINNIDVVPKYDQTQEAGRGVFNSGGFESLVYSPDFKTLWAAAETALQQDGDKSTLTDPSPARIIRYDARTALEPQAIAEYVYLVSPREGSSTDPDAEGGRSLVDLLPINDHLLLALEREFISGEPRTNTRPIALFEIDLSHADNVIDQDALSGSELSVSKRLILDFEELRQAGHVERVGSFEAMIFGPRLPDGRWSLIFLEDNDAAVDTLVIAFAVTPNH